MEFLLLLITLLAIAVIVSGLVIFFFRKPIDKIFAKIIGDELASAWRKFILFALLVVGVSSGVNIWRLEQYISPAEGQAVRVLSPELWGLHIYSTIIGTLGGLAWALFLFFVVALIAFVIVRKKESKP